MPEHNEKRLLFLIKYLPVSIVLVFTAVLIYIVIANSLEQGQQELASMKQSFITTQKNLSKDEVDKIIQRVQYERENAQANLRSNLKERVQEAYAIALSIYNANKDENKTIITKLIKNALREIRFNNSRGYYFIYSMDLKNILLPIAPELEGRDFSNYHDVKGDAVVKNIANILKETDETFYTWYWHKPQNQNKNYKKIGFSKYFEPLDCFIGTGEYVQDYESELKQELIKEIRAIRYQKNGYIFMHDYNGVALAHINESLLGKNRLDVRDKNGLPIIREFIKMAKSGGGFIEYVATINPDTKKPAPKISYIGGIDDWGWQIGAGVYLEDINIILEKKSLELESTFKNTLIKLIAISVLVGFLLIYSSLYISRLGENAFAKYKREIHKEIVKNEKQLLLVQNQNKLASMGEMIGNIAHQWRQPLNALSISISKIALLSEDGNLTKKSIEKSIKNMEKSVLYLSKTIDVFRDFFLPSSENAVFNIKEEIQSTIDIVRDSYHHHFIKIDLEADASLQINGKKKEFQQVIINLLNNAKDALTLKAQNNGQVLIAVKAKDKRIQITVQDNAGGVPKEIQDKIFEPYFTTKFQSQGTGVGLYMSKVIIETHFGGTISSVNENGGAKFIITI